MKVQFSSAVGGEPCWRCAGIVYDYTVDDTVSLIDARCSDCRADNTFCQPSNFSADSVSAVTVTKAHKESQR
jgi:hypothetical protein